MLKLIIPETEYYNEQTNEFIKLKELEISLEHSLISISKWESIWNKPFMGKGDKTAEETMSYIECMVLNKNVDSDFINRLTNNDLNIISNYIGSSMTATVINDKSTNSKSREFITSELIYYWMISFNIPFECQKWHINRLLTLVNVCNIKNAPPKNMNKKETLSNNARLNAERRKAMGTKG